MKTTDAATVKTNEADTLTICWHRDAVVCPTCYGDREIRTFNAIEGVPNDFPIDCDTCGNTYEVQNGIEVTLRPILHRIEVVIDG